MFCWIWMLNDFWFFVNLVYVSFMLIKFDVHWDAGKGLRRNIPLELFWKIERNARFELMVLLGGWKRGGKKWWREFFWWLFYPLNLNDDGVILLTLWFLSSLLNLNDDGVILMTVICCLVSLKICLKLWCLFTVLWFENWVIGFWMFLTVWKLKMLQALRVAENC